MTGTSARAGLAALALLATGLSALIASETVPAAAAAPATITVGSLPVGVRVAPDGAKAYVANFISNTISVINTATGAVGATIPVGGGTNPFGVAIAPNGTRLYVTENSAARVGVIDPATNSVVASIPVGQSPRHLAISPDSTRAYVTNNNSGTVSVVNLAMNTVVAAPFIGTGPAGIDITPDGSRVYVALQGDQAVVVINTATNTVTHTITGVGNATGLALTPDGTKAYVSDYAGGRVSVINTVTNAVARTIAVGVHGYEVAVTADGSRAYVVDDGGNALKAIDTSTDTLYSSVAVGSGPTDVAVAPDGSAVYVTNTSSNNVTVLKAPVITSAPAASFPVGQPGASTVTAAGAPTPVLATAAGAPAWLSFADNGDGTATVSGTPPSGSAGVYQFVLTASNALNQHAQTFTLTVTKLTQAITFTSPPPANAAVGGSYDVAATGGASGNPVTFGVTTPSVCAIGGAHVIFTGAGTCTISADQAGNADYHAAPTLSQSVSVAKGTQAITFTSSPPANAAVGGGYDVAATGGPSGNPVIFTVATPSVCSISVVHVTFTGAGTCTVSADQAGNDNYNAAPSASQSVGVAKGTQAITFTSTPPANAVVGGSYDVAATGGPSGNPVTFAVSTPSVCSISGAHISFTGAGTCSVNADQAGNDNYHAAPTVLQSVGVAAGAQTIMFTSTPPANATVGGSYDVAATGGPSSSPVVFSVPLSSSPVCSVSGAHVTFMGAGSCVIHADQAGDANYAAAPTATQPVSVAKGTQAITFTSMPPINAAVGGSYDVAATGGASGNPVVFSVTAPSVCTIAGAHVSFIGAGTCTVNADQPGSDNYNAAPTATQSMSVSKGTQVITFTSTPPANAAVGGSYDVAATGGASGNPVTFWVSTPSVCSISGAHLSFVAGGVCTINADQVGNANYNAAPTVAQAVSVAKGTQTITFTSTPPGNAAVGGTYDVAATGGPSGNPVVFSIPPSSSLVCAVAGARVTFTATGQCVINADQAGNDNFSAASTASQSVAVGTGADPTWLKTFPAVRKPGKLPSSVAMRARLTSTTPDKDAIAGVTLTFSLGLGTCTATTNSEGFADCSVEIPTTAVIPSTYTVSFAGTDRYAENTTAGPVVPSAQQP